MIRTTSDQAPRLLPHKLYHHAQLSIFAGKRGHGKTFALRRYISVREPRVFILDPFEDFEEIPLADDLDEALWDMQEFPVCARRVVPPITTMDPETGDAVRLGSREYALKFWGAAIRSLRDCLVVLDEMSLWSPAREDPLLLALILQGRRLGIRVVTACQRIQLVPGAMLSEATEMVLFHMGRPRDLDVVEEWAGETAREEVERLEKRQCLVLLDL